MIVGHSGGVGVPTRLRDETEAYANGVKTHSGLEFDNSYKQAYKSKSGRKKESVNGESAAGTYKEETRKERNRLYKPNF